jgi:hypothetical protein
MNIVLSAKNMKEIMTLPVIPSEFTLPIPWMNEEFETIGGVNGVGKLNLPGLRDLKSLSLVSFFPTRKYSYVSVTTIGWRCVNIINRWRASRQPIRIIVTDKGGLELLNMACLIENFTYGVDRAGDIPYTLDLKEYPYPVVK